MRARHTVVLLLGGLAGACAQGTDESDVSLRVYEGFTACDRTGCTGEGEVRVAGEPVRTTAILSRSASRFDPGMYLYAGASRGDGRFLELEVDLPTARTGVTGVEASYREYRDQAPVFVSQTSGGQVRLILEDRAVNPPAGQLDLTFEDARGERRRVVGSVHRPDVPPVSDTPIADPVEHEPAQVEVDYEPPPDDWDVFLDAGCTTDPGPEPEPSSGGGGGGGGGGGCEGDTGGDDSGGGGGGCEGDAYDGGDASGGGGCEGDSGGGGGGCEGDTGGSGGCEGGGGGGCEGDAGGGDCSVARGPRLNRGTRATLGRLLPYAIVGLGLYGRRARARRRRI